MVKHQCTLLESLPKMISEVFLPLKTPQIMKKIWIAMSIYLVKNYFVRFFLVHGQNFEIDFELLYNEEICNCTVDYIMLL